MGPFLDSQYFNKKLPNFIRTIILDRLGVLHEHLQVELYRFQEPSKRHSNGD